MWNKIINFLKNNKITLIINACFILIILILLFILGNVRNKNKILDVNLKAATEDVRQLKTKNGELIYEKQSYVTTINELEKYLDISKKQIKDLEKTLDNRLLYISKLEGQINITPSVIHDTTVIYKDSIMMFNFSFNNKWYTIKGKSEIKNYIATTHLEKVSINCPLQVGLTDKWEIFVKTPNPYVSFNNIDGALLDKNLYLKQTKKKPWNVGVQVGFGANYGLMRRQFDYGPYIGVGISYGFAF